MPEAAAPIRSRAWLYPLVMVLLLARPVSAADPDARDRVNNTALIFAARDGRLEIAKALIAAGAAVNWIDDEEVTPLILAAFKSTTTTVHHDSCVSRRRPARHLSCG